MLRNGGYWRFLWLECEMPLRPMYVDTCFLAHECGHMYPGSWVWTYVPWLVGMFGRDCGMGNISVRGGALEAILWRRYPRPLPASLLTSCLTLQCDKCVVSRATRSSSYYKHNSHHDQRTLQTVSQSESLLSQLLTPQILSQKQIINIAIKSTV